MHLVYSVMSIYDYMIARIPQGRLRFARMLRQIANLLFYCRKHFHHAVWRMLPQQTANCLNGFSHKCCTINLKTISRVLIKICGGVFNQMLSQQKRDDTTVTLTHIRGISIRTE